MEISVKRMAEIDKARDTKWRIYEAALEYIKQGIYVLPLEKNGKAIPKRKYGVNYNSASKTKRTIEKWFHPVDGKFAGWNIGIACGIEGGVFAIDVDVHGPENGVIELERLETTYGLPLEAPKQKTISGGYHYIFQWQENATSSTSKIAPGIDTRGGDERSSKGHIVAFPSEIDGNKYTWVKGGEINAIPPWVLEKMGASWRSKSEFSSSSRGNENVTAADEETQVPIEQLKRMLEAIDPNDVSYDEWLRLGQAVNTQYPGDDGLGLWDEWSSRGLRYKHNECNIRWHAFDPSGPIRVGSIFYYAKEAGWEPTKNDVIGNKYQVLVERMNKTFAIVVVGGKIKVLREKEIIDDHMLGYYDLIDKDSFKTLLQNDRVEWEDTATGKTKFVSVADIWLSSEARRTYPNGMRLVPNGRAEDGYYNTWKGFAVSPREGCCKLFLRHIKSVICNNDTSLYTWLLDWCADSIQDPANPKGCCIVMRGPEGAGKGTLADTVGKLFGPHYLHLIDDSHLLSNFNAHLMDSLFVFADEITWGGNKKSAGKLKGMITEKYLVGERKGVDSVGYRNMVHVMIASNNEWVIPAGANSRRWAVLDVPDKKVGDRDYFDELNYELEHGGIEALMHVLMTRNITSDLRTAPVTKALCEQRNLTMEGDSVMSWWMSRVSLEIIDTIDIEDNQKTWPKSVIKNELYAEYEQWCFGRKTTIPVSFVLFFTKMKKLGLSDFRPLIHGERVRAYKIPTIDTAINILKQKFGLDISTEDEDEDEEDVK